jgi:hypothetical protein
MKIHYSIKKGFKNPVAVFKFVQFMNKADTCNFSLLTNNIRCVFIIVKYN